MTMATNMYFLIFSFINIFLLCQPTTAITNSTAFFAFGDSTLDSGNNNHLATFFLANHQPYGRDLPGGVPSGRFSDGRLTPDYIVSRLGLKPLLPAYLDPTLTDRALLTGASFASGGSGLDDLTVREGNVLSMAYQLGSFERAVRRMQRAVGVQEARRVVENALYMVSAGANDMIYNYYGLPVRRSLGLSGYQNMLLGNLETSIRRLYANGARKIAVTGLPPIGCLPIQVTVGSFLPSNHMFQRVCVTQQNIDSQAYNTKLVALLSRLQSTLPGSRMVYADIYNPLMDMITNPAAYGFQHTTQGCCGTGTFEMGPLCTALTPTCPDPSRYIFWDAVHPSQATYYNLANTFMRDVLPILAA